jgi:hypothetical protein
VTEVSPGRARHGRPRASMPPAALRWPTLRWLTPRAGAAALRVVGAIVVGVVAFVISGWSPGFVGVLVGVLTWLLLTARHALQPLP